MTEKQKTALLALNKAKEKAAITDEEYLNIIEFIFREPYYYYIPYTRPDPIQPYYTVTSTNFTLD